LALPGLLDACELDQQFFAMLQPQLGPMMVNVSPCCRLDEAAQFLGSLVCMEDRPMTIDYAAAVAVAGFFITVILISKKLRDIDKRLTEMQAELDALRAGESRHFIMKLNAIPESEAFRAEPTIGSPPSNAGEVVAEHLVHVPQSPDLDVGTSLAEGDELCAKLITLVPPAEAIPLLSGREAERPVNRIEGRRLLLAWPVQKPNS
jgi:hypothetical protein